MNIRHASVLVFLFGGAAVADDSAAITSLSVERFERHFDHDDYALELDVVHGNDDHAVVLRFEGTKPDNHDTEGELQLLYSKPLSAYFDWQVGLEAALHDGSSTGGLVAGIEGEAPYRIHLEARATLNEDGDLFVHAEFERDFLIIDRLALQPRLGILAGDGGESIAAELRLRYEVTRRFVPYLGVSWEKIYGDVESRGNTALAGVSFSF